MLFYSATIGTQESSDSFRENGVRGECNGGGRERFQERVLALQNKTPQNFRGVLRGYIGKKLYFLHVGSSRAFGALGNFKLNLVTLGKGLEPVSLDC